jgi:hypothetical protein
MDKKVLPVPLPGLVIPEVRDTLLREGLRRLPDVGRLKADMMDALALGKKTVKKAARPRCTDKLYPAQGLSSNKRCKG